MNRSQHQTEALGLEIIAHEAQGERSLLVRVSGAEGEADEKEQPLKVALVLDRSGSMAGKKLAIAREAASRFVAALGESDKVAAIAYDDQVGVLFGLSTPNEEKATKLRSIGPGGSTNLYGGWKTGVDLVGEDGHVILLSDGLANVGRHTDAASLASKARQAREKSRVQTTTIGVGSDYDERLMSLMAREGCGGHYFAHTAEAVLEAFAQERFAISAVAICDLHATVGGVTKEMGSVFAGETRAAVFAIENLDDEITLRYRLPNQKERVSMTFSLPAEFGVAHEVTAEQLADEAKNLMEQVLDTTSQTAAREIAESLRSLMLKCLAHPLADEPLLRSVHAQLEDARQRAERLSTYWVEADAMVLRKRGAQSRAVMQARAGAFSSFEEDQVLVSQLRVASRGVPREREVCIEALEIRSAEYWKQHNVVPRQIRGDEIVIALIDPKERFIADEIAKETGMRVRVARSLAMPHELDALCA